MKQRSRIERGKGKRRKVSGSAAKIPKLTAEVQPSPDLEPPVPKPKPTRTELRDMIVEELASYAIDACKTIGASQRRGRGVRAPRGSGGDSANAKWLLELLLERLQEPAPDPAGAAPNTPGATGVAAPPDELAAKRTELRNLLRQQRTAMNK